MEGETTMDSGGHRSRKKWRTRKEILDSQRPFLPIGFAVLLDPSVFYIPIINEDMKCVGSDTNWLSYCTWSILVLFCYSTRDASCLEDADLVLLTITTMCSEISDFYMVPMLQNMDGYTTSAGTWKQSVSILYRWIYDKNSYIIQEEEPLEKLSFNTSNSITNMMGVLY